MARKSSITAELTLSTAAWKKGLQEASAETERWRRREQAAAAFNAGGPVQSRTGLEAREAAARMGISPMTGATQITGISLRQMAPPPIERATLSSYRDLYQTITGNTGMMKQMSKESERVRGASNSAGMGILELSRALEDAQYGLRGVLNNLPGIVQSFGGSAGLAGAISMTAVSFVALKQSFDYAKSAYYGDEAAEQAAKQRKLAEAIAETSRRANEAVEAYDRMYGSGLQQRREGALEYITIELQQANALADAYHAYAMARNQAYEGAARVQRDVTSRMAEEIAALDRQADALQKRYEFEQKFTKESAARLALLKQELAALPTFSKATVDDKGRRLVRTEFQDRAAAEQIQRKIEIEEATRRRSGASLSEVRRQQEEVEFQRKTILPIKKKAAEQEIKNAEAGELKEMAKKRKDQIASAFELMGDVADAANEALRIAKESMDRLQDRARRLTENREDAEVAHLRSRGRGAAADRRQREITERRRAEELQREHPDMSPEEARRQAQQERLDSRRGIRGAPARQFEGIDAFRRGSMKAPDFPGLDNRRAPSSSSRRVPAAADKGEGNKEAPVVAAIKESADRTIAAITQLTQTTRPPVADAVAAAA